MKTFQYVVALLPWVGCLLLMMGCAHTATAKRAPAIPRKGSSTPTRTLQLNGGNMNMESAVLTLNDPNASTETDLYDDEEVYEDIDSGEYEESMNGLMPWRLALSMELQEAPPEIGPAPSETLASSWPLSCPERMVISPYGKRGKHYHRGMDIKAPRGTPVKAAAPGVVIFSGVRRGYGDMIVIDHGDSVQTAYAHLNSRALALGDNVDKGATIGAVGSSGRATTAHLHYEVRVNGKPVNPAPLLDAPELKLRLAEAH